MKKILFIVGSTRAKSFNRQLSVVAERLLKGKAEVARVDIHDLPMINQDREFPAPEAVSHLRQVVSEADALWVFTPEYNASYPGVLKNAFDWMSRPVVAGDHETPTCICSKVVALSGAGGRRAAAGCLGKLQELLTNIGAKPLTGKGQFGVALSAESWSTDVLSLTPEQQAGLEAQAAYLLEQLG